MPTLVQMSNAHEFPFGFFVDMTRWPDEIVALGDEDVAVHVGFFRHRLDVVIEHDQVYIDPDGHMWEVKQGQCYNGASVPRIFWRLITPFSPGIRDAAAFHDVYCVSQMYSQADTHRLFWRIQRANRVNKYLAFVTWICVVTYCRFRYWSWK